MFRCLLLFWVFPRVFPCRIGLQTAQSVERSTEVLASAKIKEPFMSEHCE